MLIHQLKVLFLSFFRYRLAKWTVDLLMQKHSWWIILFVIEFRKIYFSILIFCIVIGQCYNYCVVNPTITEAYRGNKPCKEKGTFLRIDMTCHDSFRLLKNRHDGGWCSGWVDSCVLCAWLNAGNWAKFGRAG